MTCMYSKGKLAFQDLWGEEGGRVGVGGWGGVDLI